MLESLIKGFKIFVSKKTLLIIVLFLISMFGVNYIGNYIVDTITFSPSISEYPTFLFNYYGYTLLFIVLGYFVAFFISNYVTYLIAHTMLKSKKNYKKAIANVFVYTLFLSVVFLFFIFFIYLIALIFKFGFVFIILLLIIAISAFVVSLVSGLAIIFLPVSKTLNESFERAWLFLKKKFWGLVLLVLLLAVINFVISYALTYLIYLAFSKSYYLELILESVLSIILTMYSFAVIASYIKKKRK